MTSLAFSRSTPPLGRRKGQASALLPNLLGLWQGTTAGTISEYDIFSLEIEFAPCREGRDMEGVA